MRAASSSRPPTAALPFASSGWTLVASTTVSRPRARSLRTIACSRSKASPVADWSLSSSETSARQKSEETTSVGGSACGQRWICCGRSSPSRTADRLPRSGMNSPHNAGHSHTGPTARPHQQVRAHAPGLWDRFQRGAPRCIGRSPRGKNTWVLPKDSSSVCIRAGFLCSKNPRSVAGRCVV